MKRPGKPSALLIVQVTVFLACAHSTNAQDQILNVYTWAEYIDPKSIEKFEQEFEATVVVDTFDSNETLNTKLLTGRSGYDVVFPSATFARQQIAAGALAPLDKSLLPNIQHLSPTILTKIESYDPTLNHILPYTYGTTGIGYNIDLVRTRLGDEAIDSWKDFFEPSRIEKLQDCGVLITDSAEDAFPSALIYLGRDPESREPADIEAAAEVWNGIRPYVRRIDSGTIDTSLAEGNACVVITYNGDVMLAQSRADEAGNGVKLAFTAPIEGAVLWSDTMAIPADAPNPQLAHAFIDFLMRPEIAAINANFNHFATANADAIPLIDPKLAENGAIYPPVDTATTLVPFTGYERRSARLVTSLWTRFKAGR